MAVISFMIQAPGHTVKVIMLSEECHSVECQSAECRGTTVEYGKSKIGINPIIFVLFYPTSSPGACNIKLFTAVINGIS
jgi:hypothetical protein